MSKYENLYLISPALFAAELEKDIDEIRTHQIKMEETINRFRHLILEGSIRNLSNSASFVKNWHYDVRFPSYAFGNVYELETADMGAKRWRWVGPERAIELSLLLDRSIQYRLEANLAGFINDLVKEQFVLLVDDDEIPWISEAGMLYKAVIPKNPGSNGSDTTRIILGCRDGTQPAPAPGGDDRVLWFSLSSIDIQAS